MLVDKSAVHGGIGSRARPRIDWLSVARESALGGVETYYVDAAGVFQTVLSDPIIVDPAS
jgi:hypothetical protein